ncbi:MAG: hypothetical protein HYZ53_23725 [Planctomycetes bacterium]|nr:hypothetical protein [Planctomycetota bacterium]
MQPTEGNDLAPRVRAIEAELFRRLPAWACELIRSEWYRYPADPYREAFARDPDDRLMHESDWHQWGVLTHTRRVSESMLGLSLTLLAEWFGDAVAERRFGLAEERVDGLTKWELLFLSVPLHDLGKFIQREHKGWKKDGQRLDFRFKDHEAASGRIVRAWRDRFAAQGLTDGQIEHLAGCAERHFELGKVRDEVKKRDEGYGFPYIAGAEFRETALRIAADHPGYRREIGIFFIADSLGKTDIHDAIRARSDEELAAFRPVIERTLAARGIHPAVGKGALQLGINLEAARRYLAEAAP